MNPLILLFSVAGLGFFLVAAPVSFLGSVAGVASLAAFIAALSACFVAAEAQDRRRRDYDSGNVVAIPYVVWAIFVPGILVVLTSLVCGMHGVPIEKVRWGVNTGFVLMLLASPSVLWWWATQLRLAFKSRG